MVGAGHVIISLQVGTVASVRHRLLLAYSATKHGVYGSH